MTEYEAALLGAAIQDPGVLDRLDIGEELFPDPKARRLFQTIRDIYGAGQPVNFLTISESLGEAMADVIGYADLTKLTDSPTAANAEFYLSRLRDGATRRKLRELSTNIEKWTQGKADDASDIVVKIEKAIEEIGRKSADDATVDAERAAHMVVDAAEKRYAENREGPSGVQSGFPSLDAITGGFQPGEIILVGARTNVGKTALAVSMIERQAKAGIPIGLATLEMSTVQVWNRLVSIRTGTVAASKLRWGRVNGEDFNAIMDAASSLSREKIWTLDATDLTVTGFRSWATRMVDKGVKIIYLDYVGLLNVRGSNAPRWEKMGEISRDLKSTARKLGVPIVALVQLDRQAPGKKDPGLENIRDSGALEQDADTVLFLMRSDSSDDTEDVVAGKLKVKKQRNGPTGKVDLFFRKSLTHFYEAGRSE
jgi:replicative DNA helicase